MPRVYIRVCGGHADVIYFRSIDDHGGALFLFLSRDRHDDHQKISTVHLTGVQYNVYTQREQRLPSSSSSTSTARRPNRSCRCNGSISNITIAFRAQHFRLHCSTAHFICNYNRCSLKCLCVRACIQRRD
jgi:hypothetical protein